MRNVVVSEFISLDGVIEEPMWTFPYGTDEQNAFKFNELKNSDALLLGRVTYDGFAASWPNMEEETGDYGSWMNSYPKYVATRGNSDLPWKNSHRIEGDLAEEVKKLKQQPGKDILIFGSAELVNSLMKHDLIDEYRLMTYPIIIGKGKRLFNDGNDQKPLKLVDTQTFPTGVIVNTYRPAPND